MTNRIKNTRNQNKIINQTKLNKMKKYITILISICLLYSCSNKKEVNSGSVLKEYEYAITLHEKESNENYISIRDYKGHIIDLKLDSSESFNKFINGDNY